MGDIMIRGPKVMLNVPDVGATLEWYQSIGFTVERTNQHWHPDAELNWGKIRWSEAEIMINAGGSSADGNRDAALFFTTDQVDALFELLKDKAPVSYGPTDQFYGQRDFGICDPNGFELVFGQPL